MIATMLGGTFGLLPAYEADLFGSKYVGNIHGKVLLSLSFSAIGGSRLMFMLKDRAEIQALKDLLAKVDPQRFQEAFGTTIDGAEAMIKAKTLTIQKLLHILPQGTSDPSPYLYDNAFYAMSGLMAIAAVSNYTIKKVKPEYFEKLPSVGATSQTETKK